MIFDYAVIGGGVVGSAIFNKLIRVGKTCVLLDKNNDVACGVSKANSGIIHAGFDAPKNSLKAKLNVQGNKMMVELCKQLNVEYIVNGALVVSDNLNKIKDLYKRGLENGVEKLEIIDNDRLRLLVPSLSKQLNCALLAKTSGIVLPYELTIALAEEGVINGGIVKLEFEVNKVTHDKKAYTLFSKEGKEVKANYIINASGMYFNNVSKIIGAETYETIYRVGEYFILDKCEKDLTQFTIFPLPTNVSKGVLVTPTVDGNILIGPNSIQMPDYNPETSNDGLKEVKQNALKNFPNISFNKNIRNFAGVRTVVGDDFVIEKSKLKPNLVNVAGICSPGLSASPAIAEMVVRQLLEIKTPEKVVKPRIKMPIINNSSQEDINKLIKKDNNYGNIICKCEQVSMAEVINAINSPLKPKSVDAIKRRTRAGMGRCQGGYCLYSVINTIATEKNIALESVTKENKGSELIVGNIKQIGGTTNEL